MKKKRIKQLNKKYERCLYGPQKRRGWIFGIDGSYADANLILINMQGEFFLERVINVEIDPDPDGDRTDREDG